MLDALFLVARSVLTQRLDRPLATGYAVLVVFYVGACHVAVSDTWSYLSAAVFNT